MKRIAVIEDNEDNRLLLRALLGDLFELTEYDHGREALSGVAAERPDLILMDISLPEMDGTEVLRRMRQEPTLSEIPVVALTAHAMEGDRDRLLALGFDEYVSKPILEPERLIERIRELIAR